MAIIKVIEILAESDQSWEHAAQVAVENAAETLRDIRSIYIKEFEAKVEDGQIVAYRVNAKISFGIERT